MSGHVERIPVTLLTGFLGSGKTTLLARMLRDPAFMDSAVLINELGAAAVDHHLVRGASETTRVLENGCVCCNVRDDLAGALEDLYWDRLHRRIPRFRRIVIETTGLADPGPVLSVLQGQHLAAERYRWAGVICTVDGLAGEQQLGRRAEAARQAALADVLLITKADLVALDVVHALDARLAALNPAASRHAVARGEAPAGIWSGLDAVAERAAPLEAPLTRSGRADRRTSLLARGPSPLHADDVHTFTIVLRRAPRGALVHALEAIAAQHGPGLLRAKGVVHLEAETLPVVVQAAHGHLYPFTTFPAARAAREQSTLVFIIAAAAQGEAHHVQSAIRARLRAFMPDDTIAPAGA